ncbi:hypothetical protein R1flu_007702 [Riccia fluitans]|uniref:Myb-like domain-containing protein n=1 Tax=Riccia fluitans TaxID=41844 RepID=A0ABD1YZU5_9MARC
MMGSAGNNTNTTSTVAAATSSPAVNGNHTSMNNSNSTQGTSDPATTTTINNGNNGTSRPNVPATNGSGNGTNNLTNEQQPSSLQLQLLHDPGITADWGVEEQSILEEGLAKFGGEANNLNKYIKIANLLPEKTVRDVAMRCRWMTKKELGKRRKPEDQNTSKKNKDKKDKSDLLSTKASAGHMRPGLAHFTAPPTLDNDDGISNDAIGGTTGQLLEQNSHVIHQIRSNLAAMKLQENTDLLMRFRDNICAILNGMTNMPGIMSQMPPLPVKINTELADTILPKSLPQASPASQT